MDLTKETKVFTMSLFKRNPRRCN